MNMKVHFNSRCVCVCVCMLEVLANVGGRRGEGVTKENFEWTSPKIFQLDRCTPFMLRVFYCLYCTTIYSAYKSLYGFRAQENPDNAVVYFYNFITTST